MSIDFSADDIALIKNALARRGIEAKKLRKERDAFRRRDTFYIVTRSGRELEYTVQKLLMFRDDEAARLRDEILSTQWAERRMREELLKIYVNHPLRDKDYATMMKISVDAWKMKNKRFLDRIRKLKWKS